MMKRVIVGGISHETCTLTPVATTTPVESETGRDVQFAS